MRGGGAAGGAGLGCGGGPDGGRQGEGWQKRRKEVVVVAGACSCPFLVSWPQSSAMQLGRNFDHRISRFYIRCISGPRLLYPNNPTISGSSQNIT